MQEWAMLLAAFVWAEAPLINDAVPAAVVAPSANEGRCSRVIEVLGFADNERALALEQHLRCSVGHGLWDHYAIVDLIETRTRTVLASYQGSPITRTGLNNKPVFAEPTALRAQHPPWREARPLHEWTKIKRAGHFRLRKHDFKDVMVRVRLDADSPMDVHAEGTKLLITAPQGAPIGCNVVGRLVDGTEVELGHVRDAANAKTQDRGHLEVVFSAHGHLVALVHHGMHQEALTLTRTPHKNPIASTQVGWLQMIQWDAASVKELYGQIHPEGQKVWDEMVGNVE